MRQPSKQDALYAWYYAALEFGPGSPQAPIHADEPQCGYFRLKGKNGNAALPCYIAMEAPTDPETDELSGDERLICKVRGGGIEIVRDPGNAWVYLAGHPVPYEAFTQAWETGRWPDDAPGANFTPSDELSGLVDQLSSMLGHVHEFKRIESQVQCDQAANLKDRLLECHKALDAMRKAEKEPHDKAAHAVQAKFLPYLAKARDAVDELRIAMGPWLRRVETEAKAALEAAGGAGAAAQFQPKARAGGMSGKRTSTRTSKLPVIVHYKTAAIAVLDEPEVVKAVEAAVKRWFREGKTAPGVEVQEETKVI